MHALPIYTTHRTAAPAYRRWVRAFSAPQWLIDCGFLALAVAAGWSAIRLVDIIETVMLRFAP